MRDTGEAYRIGHFRDAVTFLREQDSRLFQADITYEVTG